MTERGYWTRNRVSRRAALRGSAMGITGLGAAALVGCGEEDPDATSPVSGTGTQAPTESTAAGTATGSPAASDEIKRGGVYKTFTGGDPPTIDPFGNLSFQTKGFAVFHYSRLYMVDTKPWPFSGQEAGLKGDIAENAETEDGAVWTVTLRPDVTFHNVAPVDGRALTAEDVAFSWDQLTAATSAGGDFVQFVDRLEVVDDRTLRFTLEEPFPFFLETLADPTILYIVPTEADGGFDQNLTSIGSGPFILDEYEPGVAIRRSRNPEWHVTDEDGGALPRVDAYEEAIITEYPVQRAQFEVGAIYGFTPTADDLIDVRSRHPEYWWANSKGTGNGFIFFSEVSHGDDPWADERVRQAISMALDRAALLELQYNISALVEAGFDAEVTDWGNIIPAARKPFWLDPNSPEHGESGRFFQHNPEEAVALIAAAGYPDGFDFDWRFSPRYGTSFTTQAEASHAMFQNVGLRPNTVTEDYSAVYITQTFRGEFDGIAFGPQTPFPEIGSYFTRYFTDNPLNHSRVDDATLRDLVAQQAAEFDMDRRVEIIHEIQRVNMQHAYYVPHSLSSGATFTAFQPFVQGYRQNKGGSYGGGAEIAPYYWLDQ